MSDISDHKYLLPRAPAPEPTESKPHRWTVWLGLAALLAAFACAGFTAWYAYEAHASRIDTLKALNAQAKDVERARAAAEASAEAALRLANAAQKSLKIA